MVQLSTDHEAVFSFVVQLHALHEILVGSHILIFLAVTEDGQELVQFELLVSLLLGATHLLDESVGWVQFESSEAVTQVEGIHGIVTIEVVDAKGEFSPFHIAGAKIHGVAVGGEVAHSKSKNGTEEIGRAHV